MSSVAVVTSHDTCSRVTNRVLGTLLAKCRPYLVHLNLRGCYRITEEAFMIIRQCRNLQDLNVSGLEVVDVRIPWCHVLCLQPIDTFVYLC